MFEIKPEGENRLQLIGRFDAAQEKVAMDVLYELEGHVVLDCDQLKYVSSSGLGILFATHGRLSKPPKEGGLKLINLSPHLRELFAIAGFDRFFEIE